MTDNSSLPDYPCTQRFGDLDVTFRRMAAGDRDRMLTFTRALPQEDLLFLRLDITQEDVVDGWIQNIEIGKTVSVLAEHEGRLLGYCSLHHSEILWTRHLGEIRLLVGTDHRGKGIGGELARQIFETAKDLQLLKLVVQMMSSQRYAQTLFHHLDFIPEALLHDWAIDRDGRTHDLIVMSREVEEAH
ncbi:MAG: GNAT family N-acetyltransferase [bacterium]|nr:GNAT family N-acetyltransferase [bacterium]